MDINKKKYDFNQKFITNEEFDKFYDDNRNNPEVIDKNLFSQDKQKIFDQYEFLINLPQPVQKSPEWFALRNNMITASSCGSVLGECKYQSIKETILEKIFGKEFKENKFVYHGKKYEKIATMIYEVIYNSKVGEFGLIPHQTIGFLGASPDGVSMSLTLNGQPNRLLGRMLEIKCPPSRVIQNTGKIKGDICPSYYWIQVQIQLECCDLPECDFWQAHLIEYKDEKEFIADEINDNIHTHSEIYEQDSETEINEEKQPVPIDERIRRGAIIELLPIDRSSIPPTDYVEWYGKYIYPPTLLMTPIEYRLWARETIKNIETLYPEFIGKYKFSRVVYWKLAKSHNELITRQPKWFEKNYDTLRKFWERVVYYREHPEEAKEDIIGQKLSNDVFLLTETNKIPKIKSIQQFKKDNIFIKSTNNDSSNNELIDVFASSSDQQTNVQTIDTKKTVKLPSKKEAVKRMIDKIDEWASSEDKPVVAKKVASKKNTIINNAIKNAKQENIDEWASSEDKPIIAKKVIAKKVVGQKNITKKEEKKEEKIDEFDSDNEIVPEKITTKIPVKTTTKITVDTPIKTPIKTPVKTPVKTPAKTTAKTTTETHTKSTDDVVEKIKNPPKPEPVYKSSINLSDNNANNIDNNDDIETVFIMENRKKKNKKK